MALQDSVPITTLERAVSTDVVIMQDLINRELSEVMRSMVRTIVFDPATPISNALVRPHVASGLTVHQTGGATVTVEPGILCQQVAASPPDVPAADTFDSSYRFGILMTAEDVGDPWDATLAFWLLQARVERETTLSEVRDIYNPATATFAPSAAALDKRYESQPEFLWKKGTATDIPLPDVGWAPIALCWRAAAFGALFDSFIVDVSVQLEDLCPITADSGRALRKNYAYRDTDGIGRVAGAGNVEIDLEAEVAGMKCFAKTLAGATLQISVARYTEAASLAALSVAADYWGYVYLATLPDAHPKNAFGSGVNTEINGVLVVSRTPPDENGQNTVAITPPPPFTNYIIPIGGAAHVGLVKTGIGGFPATYPTIVTAQGKGRVDFRQFNNGNFQMTQGNGFIGPAGPAYNLAVVGIGGTEDVPYGVALECVLQHQAIPAGAPVAAALETTFGMGAGGASDDTTVPTAWPRMMLSCTSLQRIIFWLFPHSGDLTMTVGLIPRTIAMANSGGGGGDGVGVIEEAGMFGFQF